MTQNNPSEVKILVVDDDPLVLFATSRVVKSGGYLTFEAADGKECLEAIRNHAPDLILLDVSLPDADGRDLAKQIKADPLMGRPFIVLLSGMKTSPEDQVKGLDAGADGYIVHPIGGTELLARVRAFVRIKEAETQRDAALEAMQELILRDELTTLLNRRGIFTLAEHQMKIACREENCISLIYCDFDGLKQINDTFGHREGDRALAETAKVIQETFRASDIVARIGGDEFVILAIDNKEFTTETLIQRLKANLNDQNLAASSPFSLSLSIGHARYNPEQPCSLDDLLSRADSAMYEQKMGQNLSLD